MDCVTAPPQGPGPPAFPKQGGGAKGLEGGPARAGGHPACSLSTTGPRARGLLQGLQPASCRLSRLPVPASEPPGTGTRPPPSQTKPSTEEKTFLEHSQTGRSLADQGVLCLQQGGRQTGLSPAQGRAQRRPERRWARPWHPSPGFLSAGLVLRGCEGHSFVLRSWPR